MQGTDELHRHDIGTGTLPTRRDASDVPAWSSGLRTRFRNLDSQPPQVSDRIMTTSYDDVVGEMRAMQERIRYIRDRYCEPKSNGNPRYLGLSNAIAGLTKAISDMEAESAP